MIKNKKGLQSYEYKYSVEASSTIDDGIHEAIRVLQKTNYWASAPGIKVANFKLFSADPIIIDSIDIEFQYLPKHFEVVGFNSLDIKETLLIKNNNKDFEVKVKFRIKEVVKIEIYLYENDETLGVLNKQCIYGIKSIDLNEVTKDLVLKQCPPIDQSSDKSDGWVLEDSQFKEYNQKQLLVDQATQISEKLGKLKKINLKLIEIPEKVKAEVQILLEVQK